MPRIFVLKGLPGSGKTTKACELLKSDGNAARVNKDDLRAMLHKDLSWSGKREKEVIRIQTSVIKAILAQNKNVIIDDCNLNPCHLARFGQIAQEGGHQLSTIFVDTPLEECIRRDDLRKNPVGEDNIRNMAFQWGLCKQERHFVVVDLDGTIADISKRKALATKLNSDGTEYLDWAEFFHPSNIWLDKPRHDVFQMVQDAIDKDHEIIICSGRSDITRNATEEWLIENWYTWHNNGRPIELPISYGDLKQMMFWSRLIMRRHDDYRPDDQLKLWFLDNYLDINKLAYVIDDRPKVIRAWMSRGIRVIDVGDGKEF